MIEPMASGRDLPPDGPTRPSAARTHLAAVCLLALVGAALLAALPSTVALTDCDLGVDILRPQTGDHVRETITIEWNKTGSDADTATSEVRLLDDGDLLDTLASTLDDGSTTWNTTTVPDASDYRIEVEVSALCGSATDVTGEFTVDNTAPANTTLDRPAAGDVAGGADVTIAWSGNETNPGHVLLEISDDGGESWATLAPEAADDGSFRWDASDLDDGDRYRLRVTRTDLAGNVGPSDVIGDFTIDNTPPTIQLDAPADGQRLAERTEISWEAVDAHAVSVEVQLSRVDEDFWSTLRSGLDESGTTTWDTTAHRDGRYRLRTVAVDAVGHRTVSQDRTVEINHHPPEVRFVHPEPGSRLEALPEVLEGTAEDPHLPVETVEVQLTRPDGHRWDAARGIWTRDPVWNPVAAPHWTMALGTRTSADQGVYSIAVRVTDSLRQNTTSTSRFVIDRAMETHNETTTSAGNVGARSCDRVHTLGGACEDLSHLMYEPSDVCDAIYKELEYDPGLMTTQGHDDVGSNGSFQAGAGTRSACAGAAWVLANVCGPGDEMVATTCDGVVGLWAETGADYLDASCQDHGSGWNEQKLDSHFGGVNHSARVGFGTGTLHEIQAEWRSWENQQLVCYQSLDRGLPDDLPGPQQAFADADICSESAIEIETKGRFSGHRVDIRQAEITISVPETCAVEGGQPALFHYRTHADKSWQEGWEALPARQVGTDGDRTRFAAVTGSFSPFVFGRLPSDNAIPQAEFSSTCDGLNCTFDATASEDEDGWIVDHEWDLGDGQTATGATVNHTYATPGSYDVVLTVRDGDGAEDITNRTVDVVPGAEGPEPRFDARCDGGRCVLDATATVDDGEVVAYLWDLDDGHTDRGAIVEHTFPADGDYRVTLTVRDDEGASGSTTQTVRIRDAAASPDDGDDDGSVGAAETDPDSAGGGILDLLILSPLPALAIILAATAVSITTGVLLGRRGSDPKTTDDRGDPP